MWLSYLRRVSKDNSGMWEYLYHRLERFSILYRMTSSICPAQPLRVSSPLLSSFTAVHRSTHRNFDPCWASGNTTRKNTHTFIKKINVRRVRYGDVFRSSLITQLSLNFISICSFMRSSTLEGTDTHRFRPRCNAIARDQHSTVARSKVKTY